MDKNFPWLARRIQRPDIQGRKGSIYIRRDSQNNNKNRMGASVPWSGRNEIGMMVEKKKA